MGFTRRFHLPVAPERQEGEPFEEYKKRQRITNGAIRRYLKMGALVYKSWEMIDMGRNNVTGVPHPPLLQRYDPYVRAKHGALDREI